MAKINRLARRRIRSLAKATRSPISTCMIGPRGSAAESAFATRSPTTRTASPRCSRWSPRTCSSSPRRSCSTRSPSRARSRPSRCLARPSMRSPRRLPTALPRRDSRSRKPTISSSASACSSIGKPTTTRRSTTTTIRPPRNRLLAPSPASRRPRMSSRSATRRSILSRRNKLHALIADQGELRLPFFILSSELQIGRRRSCRSCSAEATSTPLMPAASSQRKSSAPRTPPAA